MSKASREVLHVFDYKNVKSQSVLHANDDSRIIEQRRDNDILIFRQGGEDVAPTSAWTHLATLVQNQLGGFDLVEEESNGFLNDDFDIYEYLSSVEEKTQERVSFDEKPTEHRKLSTATSAPTNVFVGLYDSNTVRVSFNTPSDISGGSPTQYNAQISKDGTNYQASFSCGLTLYCDVAMTTLNAAPYSFVNG